MQGDRDDDVADDGQRSKVPREGTNDPTALLEQALGLIGHDLSNISLNPGVSPLDVNRARVIAEYTRALIAAHKPIKAVKPGEDEEELIRQMLEALPPEALEQALGAKRGKR